VIERVTGTLLFWPKVRGWQDVPLKALLEREHGLPTIVEDSARTMAVAEQAFGQGQGLQNFVHVMVGTGLGATLFVGGELYIGSSGLAGELVTPPSMRMARSVLAGIAAAWKSIPPVGRSSTACARR